MTTNCSKSIIALRKHFVYIDHIDELKQNSVVTEQFNGSLRIVNGLINKLKVLRIV